VYPRRRMRLTELVTPLKPLEALAEGRIVLASNVGGHREMLSDNVTGFLFCADDAAALARACWRRLSATDQLPRMREAGGNSFRRSGPGRRVPALSRGLWARAGAASEQMPNSAAGRDCDLEAIDVDAEDRGVVVYSTPAATVSLPAIALLHTTGPVHNLPSKQSNGALIGKTPRHRCCCDAPNDPSGAPSRSAAMG